jgi:hypothetical protein
MPGKIVVVRQSLFKMRSQEVGSPVSTEAGLIAVLPEVIYGDSD